MHDDHDPGFNAARRRFGLQSITLGGSALLAGNALAASPAPATAPNQTAGPVQQGGLSPRQGGDHPLPPRGDQPGLLGQLRGIGIVDRQQRARRDRQHRRQARGGGLPLGVGNLGLKDRSGLHGPSLADPIDDFQPPPCRETA